VDGTELRRELAGEVRLASAWFPRQQEAVRLASAHAVLLLV
jgi:hypothetical protein